MTVLDRIKHRLLDEIYDLPVLLAPTKRDGYILCIPLHMVLDVIHQMFD